MPQGRSEVAASRASCGEQARWAPAWMQGGHWAQRAVLDAWPVRPAPLPGSTTPTRPPVTLPSECPSVVLGELGKAALAPPISPPSGPAGAPAAPPAQGSAPTQPAPRVPSHRPPDTHAVATPWRQPHTSPHGLPGSEEHMGAGEAPPAPTATGVLSRDPRQERRLLLRSAPCAQRCGSSGRPARFSRGGCLVTTRWRGPRAHTLEGGARGCQAPRARVGCMPTGSASPQLGRPLQEAGADPVPRVWRPSAHPPGARPAPVAEQKPAAAWPPATGVFPRSASRVPTRLCPAPSFTSDVAQTLSGPQKAPPDSDRGGTPRGRGERCGPVQSSCVPFLFSLITIVFLILKSCSRKGSVRYGDFQVATEGSEVAGRGTPRGPL